MQLWESIGESQFGQVRSIHSSWDITVSSLFDESKATDCTDLKVAVILLLIIRLFLGEVVREMTQYSCSIAGTTFKSGNAARTAPSFAVLYTDDDVLIEEARIFEETYGGFWSELVGSKFAHTDQVTQPF